MTNDPKPPKHRPFHTIFEWAVVAIFLMMSAALFLLSDRVLVLEEVVHQNTADIERMAVLVQKLWDIWGR